MSASAHVEDFCQGDYVYEHLDLWGEQLWHVFHIPDGQIIRFPNGKINRDDCLVATIFTDDAFIHRIAHLLALEQDKEEITDEQPG